MLYPANPLKSLIIELLADKTILNAKSIKYELKNYYSKNITIQGIYKALNALKNEGVLAKHNDMFRLSLNFLENISMFSAKLLNSVSKIQQAEHLVQKLETKTVLSQQFSSELENYNFYIELMLAIALQYQQSNIPCYQFLYHFGMINLPQGSELINSMRKHNKGIKTFLSGSYASNIRASKVIAQKKEEVRITKKQALGKKNSEFGIYGDIIYEVQYNSQYKSYYHKHLENYTKHQTDEPLLKLLKGNHPFEKPITVTIEKNKERAEQLITSLQSTSY